MEEENKEEPKKPWDYHPKYHVEQGRRKDEIYRSTLEYFEKSDKVQHFKNRHQQHLIQQQLESYAWRKAEWLVTKEYQDYWYDHRLMLAKEKAEECLENIQQKRLFDKNCEWRAEVFTHPAIETTHDFDYWEYNVLNCPFIDPITPEDIELYIEYLNEYFGEDVALFARWQDYDTYCTNRVTVIGQMYKEELENAEDGEEGEDNYVDEDDEEAEDGDEDEVGRLMPPWYLFWEERRGASNYGLLKDVRKDKEMVYAKLGLDEEMDEARAKMVANPPDKRPWLSLYEEDKVRAFIEECENPAEKTEIIKAYETHRKVYYDKEETEAMYWVKEAWYDLEDCLEAFPIAEGITDWKEALIQTAKNWEHQKLIRMLPVVYDEYLFRRETGIAHPYDEKQAVHYRKFADKHKEHILRGRELKGEPRDLNF